MLSVAHLLLVLLLAIVLSKGDVSMHNPFYCYSQDPLRPQLGGFGIRSAYETNRGRSINPNVSTCNPSKFWMYSRHGTRLPMPEEVANMLEHNVQLHNGILSNYDQGKASLCASDFDLLRNWIFDPNITLENAFYLAPAGRNELKEIAQRYQSAFPSILSSTYSPNDYSFRPANTQRSIESILGFADGLFGVNGSGDVQFEDIPTQDYLLTSFALCPLYQQVVAIKVEQNEFREGPEYQEMTRQVTAKLGFHGSHALRAIEVDILARICMYEQIWDLNSTSPFCAAFSVANHQVIEYYDDLDYYYRLGYGYSDYRRLFENMGCFIMQDMLQFLQSNDDVKARILNTQNENRSLFYVTLGTFGDDVPLTRHNFAQQENRVWKSSLITPMANNLVVVRFDCSDGDNDLLFLYNEKPLPIPGCEPNGLCKQSVILERFSRFLDVDCMEVFCTNS